MVSLSEYLYELYHFYYWDLSDSNNYYSIQFIMESTIFLRKHQINDI